MEMSSSGIHSEPKKSIDELQERLATAEEELRSLREGQRRMAQLYESFRTNLEKQQFDQQQARQEIARQRGEIRAAVATSQQILESRIWRTLVWLGSIALRIQDRKLPPQTSAPAPVPIGKVQTPNAPSRASAARHAQATMTVERWARTIRSVLSKSVPPAGGAPRISIITPTWNTEIGWFAEAALSVIEQSSPDWEWCIVDDGSTKTDFFALFSVLEETGRVKIQRANHGGISHASNLGLESAAGEYVCFLDHDDLLHPAALAECLEALDQGFDAVYTDSDKVDEAGVRRDPFHKPDWSPEYFRGVMYVGHLLCVRRDLALAVGGFDSQYNGVQDFEFMLRLSEKTKLIGHIDKVLYHWRTVPGSIATSTEAKAGVGRLQSKAVQEQLSRLGMPAISVPHSIPHRLRIVPLPAKEHPLISIIIPTKDSPDVLQRCLSSLVEKTTYPNVEIICVDNETTEPRALHLLRTYPVTRLLFPGRFNFSRANNLGSRRADGEYLVFMNNAVEVITEEWAEEMLYYAAQEDVGAVGSLLLYPDRTVQHAGVVPGCRGTADHVLRGAPADSDGYAGSLSCAHEVSAVTAACMMVKKRDFDKVGGFNEHYLTSYQDVDLCLSLRALGARNIFAPRAVFYHLESYSRGQYYDLVDRNLLLDRWEEAVAADPYYNANFDAQACDYTLKSV
jgi:O-antigen biosynthesis protein